MEKISVIHVLTDKNVGGAGRWLLYFLKCYDIKQFDVKVIVPKESALIEYLRDLNATIIEIDHMQEKSFSLEDINKFKRIFKEYKPDIVHTHASLSARIGAKLAKVKCIINTKHCMETVSSNFIKRTIKKRINEKFSNVIIAVSNAVAKSMIDGGVNEKQIVTVYNGILIPNIINDNEKKLIKDKYGICEDDKVVGIVARLEEVKNVAMFIEAANEIISKGQQNIKFLIAGTGTQEKELKALTCEYNIEDKVIFAGFIKEIEVFMSIFDINVITSVEEALCISIIEGMSLGIPAIGTATGGIEEVIEDGVNGYIVRVGDYVSLANRIVDLLKEKERYEVYKKNAIETVNGKFLAEDMAKKVQTIYIEQMKCKN